MFRTGKSIKIVHKLVDARGWRVGVGRKWEVTANEYRVVFENEENVLILIVVMVA